MNINWTVDWSQGSTQRNAIMMPFAIAALWLSLTGDTSAAVIVIGLAQTIYRALGIAISDVPK